MNKITELKKELELSDSQLDGCFKSLKRKFSPRIIKYFEDCIIKIKYIYRIKDKIEELDKKYWQYIDLCIRENRIESFETMKYPLPFDCKRQYQYSPSLEAMEFENLLFQGKAALDFYSKAIGCIFDIMPRNLDGLINALSDVNVLRKNPAGRNLLKIISNVEGLKGVISDPKKEGKKSIRDLIAHYQRAEVIFFIHDLPNSDKLISSKGALLDWRSSSRIELFPNYLVTNISNKVWYYIYGLAVQSFNKLI